MAAEVRASCGQTTMCRCRCSDRDCPPGLTPRVPRLTRTEMACSPGCLHARAHHTLRYSDRTGHGGHAADEAKARSFHSPDAPIEICDSKHPTGESVTL